ncbi:MAG: hypothetical protein BA871_03800 [Desulfuromonadales bacterium C00003096]|jgi:hypothetical protein|nr:MAG: hypothetical protein BA871_03800 [Desulfuromonadales bacterium C00003096]
MFKFSLGADETECGDLSLDEYSPFSSMRVKLLTNMDKRLFVRWVVLFFPLIKNRKPPKISIT